VRIIFFVAAMPPDRATPMGPPNPVYLSSVSSRLNP